MRVLSERGGDAHAWIRIEPALLSLDDAFIKVDFFRNFTGKPTGGDSFGGFLVLGPTVAQAPSMRVDERRPLQNALLPGTTANLRVQLWSLALGG
jgi:hypothetical protein